MDKSLYLLIKPASGLCNLQCTYCFYHDVMEVRDQKDHGMMKKEVLETIVKKAFDYADGTIVFAFQGGEPTLIGLDFYRTFIDLVNKYGNQSVATSFTIQTNGLLIDEAWAKFFFDNDFLVGLSLDGYRKVNDLYRCNQFGEGAFDRVLQACDTLEAYGVDYNILSVVTQDLALNGEAVYKFFKDRGLGFLQFIPCMDPIRENHGQEAYTLTPEAYGNFLIIIFDLWYEDFMNNDYVSIRMFDNLVKMIKGFGPESCDMAGMCSRGTVIEGDGSLYPCDFYVLDQWRIGNIVSEDFATLIASSKMDEFVAESRLIGPECKGCNYVYLCRCGCMRDRIYKESKGVWSNKYCQAFKTFFDHGVNKLYQVSRLC